jgi:hypothetical protein
MNSDWKEKIFALRAANDVTEVAKVVNRSLRQANLLRELCDSFEHYKQVEEQIKVCVDYFGCPADTKEISTLMKLTPDIIVK